MGKSMLPDTRHPPVPGDKDMISGFISLGMQGKYVAINLAEAGFDLVVFDTRLEPLDDLAVAGAKIAASCADTTSGAAPNLFRNLYHKL